MALVPQNELDHVDSLGHYPHPLSSLDLVGMATEQRFSAFFYGTLLHPDILKRVIGNDGSHLEICPAVLLVSASIPHSLNLGGRNLTPVHHIGSHKTPG